MPQVSIITPCYNEAKTIRFLLEAVLRQSFPRHEMEVILADGLSTDGTRQEIAAFQQSHPDLCVRLVDNPQRNIPAGLNRALAAAAGKYIIRLDAHSIPHPTYVERCLAGLEQGLGDNVGGMWEIRAGGEGWVARSIAVAAAHPFGVGDARYRVGGAAQAVDTVPFGAFRRALIDKIGPFDERLLSNEDYELNARIRKAGGRVWLDPAIRSVYFARSSWPALIKQYWRYGFWKARMLLRYPETFRWRQLAGLFVLSFIGLALAGLVYTPAWWLLLLETSLYLGILLAAGVKAALDKQDAGLIPGLPLAIASMHFSWGSGFLWSMLTAVFSRSRQ